MPQLVKKKFTWCRMISLLVYQQIPSDMAFTLAVKSCTAIKSNNTWKWVLGVYFKLDTYSPPSRKLQTFSSRFDTKWKVSLIICCCVSSLCERKYTFLKMIDNSHCTRLQNTKNISTLKLSTCEALNLPVNKTCIVRIISTQKAIIYKLQKLHQKVTLGQGITEKCGKVIVFKRNFSKTINLKVVFLSKPEVFSSILNLLYRQHSLNSYRYALTTFIHKQRAKWSPQSLKGAGKLQIPNM